MKLHCPYCRRLLDADDAERTRCPYCGRCIEWLQERTDFVVNDVDLWRLGRGQRMARAAWLLRLAILLAVLAINPLPALAGMFFLAMVLVIASLFSLIMMVAGIHDMRCALSRSGRAGILLSALLGIEPLSTLALVVLNLQVARVPAGAVALASARVVGAPVGGRIQRRVLSPLRLQPDGQYLGPLPGMRPGDRTRPHPGSGAIQMIDGLAGDETMVVELR